MEKYANTFENSDMIFRTLQGLVRELEQGDILTWIRIREGIDLLLRVDKELQELFIIAAQKKGVKFEENLSRLS